MNRGRQAFQACLLFGCGIFFGLVVFFSGYFGWRDPSFKTAAALYVANVLLSALIAAAAATVILGCLIFPLQYFVIRRYNRLAALIFFAAGFAFGDVIIRFLMK